MSFLEDFSLFIRNQVSGKLHILTNSSEVKLQLYSCKYSHKHKLRGRTSVALQKPSCCRVLVDGQSVPSETDASFITELQYAHTDAGVWLWHSG